MQGQETKTPIDSAPSWWQSDDAWAMIMAAGLLVITWLALQPVLIPATGETSFENLLAPWVAKPGSWSANPLVAFDGMTHEAGPSKGFPSSEKPACCCHGHPSGCSCMAGKHADNNKKSSTVLCTVGICWRVIY